MPFRHVLTDDKLGMRADDRIDCDDDDTTPPTIHSKTIELTMTITIMLLICCVLSAATYVHLDYKFTFVLTDKTSYFKFIDYDNLK